MTHACFLCTCSRPAVSAYQHENRGHVRGLRDSSSPSRFPRAREIFPAQFSLARRFVSLTGEPPFPCTPEPRGEGFLFSAWKYSFFLRFLSTLMDVHANADFYGPRVLSLNKLLFALDKSRSKDTREEVVTLFLHGGFSLLRVFVAHCWDLANFVSLRFVVSNQWFESFCFVTRRWLIHSNTRF